VGIHEAGKNQAPGGIYHLAAHQVSADVDDSPVLHTQVSLVVIGCGDDRPAFDDQIHIVPPAYSVEHSSTTSPRFSPHSRWQTNAPLGFGIKNIIHSFPRNYKTA